MNIFENPEKLEKVAEALRKNPYTYHIIFKENIAGLTEKAVVLTEKANGYIYNIWEKTFQEIPVIERIEEAEKNIIGRLEQESKSIKDEVNKTGNNVLIRLDGLSDDLKSTIVDIGKVTALDTADKTTLIVGQHEESSKERFEIGKRYMEGLSVKVGGIGDLVESVKDEIITNSKEQHKITRRNEMEKGLKEANISEGEIPDYVSFLEKISEKTEDRTLYGDHVTLPEHGTYKYIAELRREGVLLGFIDEEITAYILDEDVGTVKTLKEGIEKMTNYVMNKRVEK